MLVKLPLMFMASSVLSVCAPYLVLYCCLVLFFRAGWMWCACNLKRGGAMS